MLDQVIPASLLVLLAGFSTAQKPVRLPEPIAPLSGALVLAGGGELPASVLQVFVRLAGGGAARLVLVGGRKDDVLERAFRAHGVASVDVVRITGKSQLRSAAVLEPMLAATGIWLASGVAPLRGSGVFERLLQGAVARGGVVGGTGAGARVLAKFKAGKPAKPAGFDLLPRAVVDIVVRGQWPSTELRRAHSDCAEIRCTSAAFAQELIRVNGGDPNDTNRIETAM